METTAVEIYRRQNKAMHRGISGIGFAYNENRGFWVQTFREITCRKNARGMSSLTLAERREVINHLRRRGVDVVNPNVPKVVKDWKKGDPDRAVHMRKRPMKVGAEKKAMVGKVHAILADMKLPWSYVDEIAKKRFGVEFVEWLKVDELRSVVQMMAIYQKRHK